MRKRVKRSRGFTLIELGIVIAVIAVLAVVVLAGTGFMESSRLGKSNDFVGKLQDGIATLAGRRGGQLTGMGGCPAELLSRTLVPPNFNVAGAVVPNWTFNCAFGPGVTAYTITVNAENAVAGADMVAMNATHPACVVAGGAVVTFTCNL
jgi:prepilin-type N-terminal cleavage/methylation domain-containing protein